MVHSCLSDQDMACQRQTQTTAERPKDEEEERGRRHHEVVERLKRDAETKSRKDETKKIDIERWKQWRQQREQFPGRA